MDNKDWRYVNGQQRLSGIYMDSKDWDGILNRMQRVDSTFIGQRRVWRVFFFFPGRLVTSYWSHAWDVMYKLEILELETNVIALCYCCVAVHFCFAGRVVSWHSVTCCLSFCSHGEVCLFMIAVSVCHACDAAVYGCLVAMYFIPRERCWLEGGCVHSAPRVISLIMLMSFLHISESKYGGAL